ncbi:MAG: response regulator [Gammaproteobacteria bacterium]|nr:response regulator [Gammaproteobacteria bacterium]
MQAKPNILVVDDDQEIRELLTEYLTKYDFLVKSAKNRDEMLHKIQQETFDLILLDLMLPGANGIELCQELRKTSNIPIIIVTAIDEETDRIIGLEAGADDYVVKPFNPRELVARIKAVLRRSTNLPDTKSSCCKIYQFSLWQLNTKTRQFLSPDKIEISLSSGEYNLLLAFLEHAGHVITREQLLEFTKDREMEAFDRSIDVQVSRLRHKIELDPKNPQLIKTIRGGGYILATEVKIVS